MNLMVIATNTFREGIRKKTLIGMLLVALIAIVGSTFLESFSSGDPTKMMKDVCLTTLMLFGAMIAIFMAGSAIPSEIENRIIHTIVSKPLWRWEYVVGKYVGIQLIVFLNMIIMSGTFLILLYTREPIFSTPLVKATILTLVELMLISSYTMAVSVVASSPVLPVVCGFFIYIVGNLTSYLKNLGEHALEEGRRVLATIITLFYNVLPDLSVFHMRDQVLYASEIDPTVMPRILNFCLYGLLHVVVALVIAFLIFRRKEL